MGLDPYISDRSNAESTQYADFHGRGAKSRRYGDSRKSRHTTKITAKATVIVNT